MRGEGEADEQVDRAELLVEDGLRDVGEEEPERRAEIQPEVPPQERSSLQPVEGRPDEPGEERGDDVRQGKPEPEERDRDRGIARGRDPGLPAGDDHDREGCGVRDRERREPSTHRNSQRCRGRAMPSSRLVPITRKLSPFAW